MMCFRERKEMILRKPERIGTVAVDVGRQLKNFACDNIVDNQPEEVADFASKGPNLGAIEVQDSREKAEPLSSRPLVLI
jgi:hypothetical protein